MVDPTDCRPADNGKRPRQYPARRPSRFAVLTVSIRCHIKTPVMGVLWRIVTVPPAKLFHPVDTLFSTSITYSYELKLLTRENKGG